MGILKALPCWALVTLVAVGAVIGPAGAQEFPQVPDRLRAFSILPPGQNGYFNLADLSAGQLPANAGDQLDMYVALVDDDDVTELELPLYFKPFQFGPAAAVTREYQPTEGATVMRDEFGVPHIFAATDAAGAFALGYVTAEDRLWQMDLLRHAAKGELSSFLGSDYVEVDKTLRRDGYTRDELQEFFDSLDDEFGVTGASVQEAFVAYADGVNARMAEVRADFALRPVEYQSLQIVDWDALDTVALAVLQLRRLGVTGGAELSHAALYQGLRRKLGGRLGKAVFSDLVRESSGAPTTIPSSEGTFPSQDLPKPDPEAIAIPDNLDRLIFRMKSETRAVRESLRGLVLPMRSSNFIGVAPEVGAGGHSLEFGGPQVGYSIPQFFMEIDVHTPSLDFRGPAVPGASLLVPLGRGIDYAWSLTTGSSDNVDVRVEKLCGPNSYVFNGRCRKMEVRTESIEVRGGDPVSYKVYRTVHGPVQDRATVDGEPVAIVKERAFWNQELASIPFFYSVNSNSMNSVQEFAEAAAGFSMSFNTIYVDADDIGYWHAGRYPVRAAGVDPMLPSWGTGEWEWDGMLPFGSQPQMINPPSGWLVNWNNKPSTEWENGDSSYWGPASRVGVLADQMERITADGAKVELSDIVDVIRTVATQDVRAVEIGPEMIELAGDPATDIVADWIDAGAHRIDRNHDDQQDFGPAVALYDAWFTETVHAIFDDELKGVYPYLGQVGSNSFGDEPYANNGSAFYAGFQNYLLRLFEGGAGLARNYCDNRKTDAKESCAAMVRRALDRAIADVSGAQGDDPSAWTAPADHITFDAVGAMSIPPSPWQNRGTWNHAVEVLGRR